SSLLEEDNSLEVRKLTATGGEIVAGIANSLVWQFAGPDEYTAMTLLDFSMLQPVLRAGGRAVVMENLTDSERALLTNVRQMERFRHGFYAQIVAGSSSGPGPMRGGLGLVALQPPLPGGAGGIFDLMETKVRINNQRSNVAGLRDSLDQFEAFYDAERIDKLQVDQTRQTLYHAQIQLASLKQNYQDGLDGYKISLGLPPSLDVRIDDPLLDPFELIDEKTVATQEMVATLLVKLRDPDAPFTPEDTAAALDALPLDCREVLEIMDRDLRRLDEAAPARCDFLKLLVNRPELRNGDVDPRAADLGYFEQRLANIRDDFVKQQAVMRATLDEYEQFARASEERTSVGPDDPLKKSVSESSGATAGLSSSVFPGVSPRTAGQASSGTLFQRAADGREIGPADTKELVNFLTLFSGELADLSLTQARCRVETATLTPVDLTPGEALEIARRNRLDWMNARAALVDSWRQIEVSANALRSDLDVTFSGDINTLGNNPLRFRGTTGRLRVGLQFDPPLTRLVERNLYREALIDYQQARRRYYAYEDRVSQSLRDILRTIYRYQLDFELRRAAVSVSISQVDVMQLRLQRPPKPGEANVFGATTARDLVGALSTLLNTQNSFLSAWVDYEVQRLNLNFDLGTMELDARGEWIDPGPIRFDRYLSSDADAPAAEQTEEIPAPDAMPIPETLPSP
ncbi:MAG: TolC family protein, partial [Pirellulales bacterium]|nr:TolC family protein [Pirellulales bacterium]